MKKLNLLLIVFTLSGLINFCKAQPIDAVKPRNIIIMIGDGMGFNHIKATEYYLYGTDSSVLKGNGFIKLAEATFPAIVETKTDRVYNSGYNTEAVSKNPQILSSGFTDSGAAATAMATGKKTYRGAIGMSVENDTLQNLVELAKGLGKAAGIITSVPACDATPAGFSVHSKSRGTKEEIFQQEIIDSRLDVLMGCGNPDYNKDGLPQQMDAKLVGGDSLWAQLKNRTPQINFNISGHKYTVKDIDNDSKPDAWTLIQDSAAFAMLNGGNPPKRVLGIPKVNSTLQQERTLNEGSKLPFETPFIKGMPTLQLMTEGALNVLSRNPKGFFLMIEGGAIDWASHSNQSDRMIEETAGFLDAIEAVVKWVNKNSNWQETMLVITADHECGFLWAEEGNDKFYPITNKGKGNLPGMKWYSKDHTNSLVPFYAKGAGSNLFNLFADEYDPNYGYFIQNTEIAQTVFLLWGNVGK